MKPSLLFTALLSLTLAMPLAHASGTHAGGHASNEQTDWGIAGKARRNTKTITIIATDAMRFTPGSVTVKEGDTVRFVVKNKGRMQHEMVIGTPAGLAEHAAEMAKSPGMQHDDPYMTSVASGKTGQIVWTFNRAGNFEFACLIAGHYQAGMKGAITVTPKAGASKAAAPAVVPVAPVVQAQPAPASASTAQALAMADGNVRKIDAANGKVTLKHGPIVNLDMPGMTMVFRVQPPTLLNNIKVDDTVKFHAERIDGTFTVTAIEVVR